MKLLGVAAPQARVRPATVITPGQVEEADALVLSGSRVYADSFHTNGRLTLIAQFGAGFDHIDVEAATQNGVAVANIPSRVRRPVAVSILALMLALTGSPGRCWARSSSATSGQRWVGCSWSTGATRRRWPRRSAVASATPSAGQLRPA